MFYTYILFSEKMQKHYVGQTNNIEKRIERHNLQKEKSTKYGTPWKLIYSEKLPTRSEAMLKEKQIKKRGAKRFLEDLNMKNNSIY